MKQKVKSSGLNACNVIKKETATQAIPILKKICNLAIFFERI